MRKIGSESRTSRSSCEAHGGGKIESWRRYQTNTEIGEVLPPARFISLLVRAGEVFALAWLETPNPSLQGRSPIEAAMTEEGFEQADEILTRIENGILG